MPNEMPNENSVWELEVTGMTCATCEHHVTRAIEGVGGRDVTASSRQGTATFTATDPDPTAITNAVNDAGYRAGTVRQAPTASRRAAQGDAEWDLASIGSGGAAFAGAPT